jgi:hypothetical protein
VSITQDSAGGLHVDVFCEHCKEAHYGDF